MTLALYGKSRRRKLALGLVALVSLVVAMSAGVASLSQGSATVAGPVSGAGIAPVPISGNPKCSELDDLYGGGQTWLGAKIDQQPENDTYDLGDGKSVTISNVRWVDGQILFDWSSNFGVDAVFVKQSDYDSNLYVYAATAAATEATSDTGLGPQPGQNQGSISHVDFCYDAAAPSTAELVIKKVVVGEVSTDAFQGTVAGPGSYSHNFTGLTEVVGDEEHLTGLALGSYTVTETPVTTGFNLLGYKVGSLISEALACPAEGAPYDSNTVVLDQADETVVVCIYNQRGQVLSDEQLYVKKIVTDGQDASQAFTGSVTGLASSDWSLNHEDFAFYPGVGTGSFTVVEDNPAPDYSLVGFRVVDLGPESIALNCPDPDDSGFTADPTGAVTLAAHDRKLVCVYNEPAEVLSDQQLYVKKIVIGGQDAPAPFTGAVTGLDQSGWALNHEDFAFYPGIAVGAYTVVEDNPGPAYRLVGYRVVTLASTTTPLTCPDPAAPGFTAGSSGAVTLGENEVKLVCVYNEPLGRLIIKKVNYGGEASAPFTADIAGGPQNIPFSQAHPSDYIYLPAGPVTVSEDSNSAFTYLGFAVHNGDATCDRDPDALGLGAAPVTIVAGDTRTVCFYNERIIHTPTPTPTSTPTETPTPTSTPTLTPTPETPTPVTPTPETPTVVPTTPATTPTEAVAGVKTPGAPSAGTGVGATSDGAAINVLVLFGSLILMTASLGAIALAHRRVS